MCVVSNGSQQLSRPILWIVTVCATYWAHTTAVYALMVALTRIQLPTHPCHPSHPTVPLPPAHLLIDAICDSTVAVKQVDIFYYLKTRRYKYYTLNTMHSYYYLTLTQQLTHLSLLSSFLFKYWIPLFTRIN